jgi:hypothetical protein
MSCHNSNNRKRIAIFAGIGAAGAAAIGYASLAANPAAAAALPAVIAFAACPAMCAAMGGAMWLSRRFKKRNNVMLAQTVKNDNKDVNEEQLLAATAKTDEKQSLDDNGKEIAQVQYSNKRKLKARQVNDTDSVASSSS